MHEHHTVPQCCGGVNSKRVILCGTCHNAVHAHALHVFRALSNNKAVTKSFWESALLEERANPLVRIIVNAFARRNIEGVSEDQTVSLGQAKVPIDVYRKLKAIKQDSGLSSLEKTLAYCIEYVFSHKGLTSGQQKSTWHQAPPRKMR